MAIYSPNERALLRDLSDIFATKGYTNLDAKPLMDQLNLSEEAFSNAIRVLEGHGLIASVTVNPFYGAFFQLTPLCVQASREIQQEDIESTKPGNYVDIVSRRARENRIIAGIIIFLSVVGVPLVVIVQIFTMLQMSGCINKPQPPTVHVEPAIVNFQPPVINVQPIIQLPPTPEKAKP
jgi:hypothetical protein